MISVIIPLYNKAHYIAETLQSVFRQTYTDYEIIVIDDGSMDDSADIVDQMLPLHPSLRLLRQENRGVSATRNRGIQEARGEWIAFLDADDQWHTTHLSTMMQLQHLYPAYRVFCSAQEGRPIQTLPKGVSIISDHCRYDYLFFTGCMFVHREVLQKVGLFRVGIQLGEDRDMWLRIACHYPTVYLNKATVIHPYNTENNLSRTIDPIKVFPYWEWYDYPYPNRKSLYRYATNQIVKYAATLARQNRYDGAWLFLLKTRGTTAVRPRLRLLLNIICHTITQKL